MTVGPFERSFAAPRFSGRWLLYSTDTGLKNWLKICGMDFDMHLGSREVLILYTPFLYSASFLAVVHTVNIPSGYLT
jgi:hypothetical protein